MNDISKQTKINQLISNWPKNTLKTVKELESLGYTPQLLKVYSNSNWIELFTRGMYKLYNDEVTWQGVLHGMQQGVKYNITCWWEDSINIKRIRTLFKSAKNKHKSFLCKERKYPCMDKEISRDNANKK